MATNLDNPKDQPGIPKPQPGVPERAPAPPTRRDARPRTFEPPLANLSPRLTPVSLSKALEPLSIVTLVFRGGPPVVDKFDGRDYIVPPLPADVDLWDWQARFHEPSTWQVEYQVAAHLQTRAVVPGSRNPHSGKTASQIGILEVDRPDRVEPFTDEELKQFGLAEAIDRRAAELPSMRDVKVIPTTQAVSAAMAAGQNIDARLEEEPGEDVTAPPEHHEGLAELRKDEADFRAAGGQASRTTPSKGRK